MKTMVAIMTVAQFTEQRVRFYGNQHCYFESTLASERIKRDRAT